MTYDMLGAPNKNTPGHHAELNAVKTVIEAFISHGCPPGKLILGLPAYARHGENHAFIKTYSEIIDAYGHGKLGTVDGYFFDSPEDVTAKVKYAKKAGLGGIFLWELGQDKQTDQYEGGILLQTAAHASVAAAKDEL